MSLIRCVWVPGDLWAVILAVVRSSVSKNAKKNYVFYTRIIEELVKSEVLDNFLDVLDNFFW